ncbi:Ig-like domain-containing protein [Mycobacterium sp. OTB74]|uniref:L,D-transpeptidase n=1 Tax=Mycobacterium sp. OTB74 TaxID=1853452 RepID=UPI0024746A0E|nr:Ig-like domain-containing protein [Mycobacterium sp. OTB74]MDH6244886.1 lipoprotein-anchoring transpeptidase ErfK/SrfK [Mycobacterium sp. OTB74]
MLTSSRRVRGAWLAAVLAVLAVLGGATVSSTSRCADGCRVVAAARDLSASAQPAPEPAALKIVPAAGLAGVNPAAPVSVTAVTGTVTSVAMENESGKTIPGTLSADGKTWTPAEQLGYGRTYTMTIDARGNSGMPSRQTSSFNTLSPDYQTTVYLNTVSGAQLQEGGTYGIGTVVVAHFDDKIEDKAAAERAMTVTTNPPVFGSWHWIDDSNAHWRPERYYAPGTTVTVDAKVYGLKVADGTYGQEDERVSLRIGDAHVSIADDNTKQVSVFENGKLIRTMPTSMGMGGTEMIGERELSFWTPPGVYTVMDKANPVIMDSSTFGLPVNSRLGYKETIPWATRISADGIYLHQLNATIWAQGKTNTSHGCLNLNGENAEWFYNFSQPGDVVEIHNTGGPPQRMNQNGDWSMPWDQWLNGSRLPR